MERNWNGYSITLYKPFPFQYSKTKILSEEKAYQEKSRTLERVAQVLYYRNKINRKLTLCGCLIRPLGLLLLCLLFLAVGGSVLSHIYQDLFYREKHAFKIDVSLNKRHMEQIVSKTKHQTAVNSIQCPFVQKKITKWNIRESPH